MARPIRRVAFYAPMKPPDHPVPSGDREIARGLMAALGDAGFACSLASSVSSRDGQGCPAEQSRRAEAADAEAGRLIEKFRGAPPALWFTYHSYHKAPDLIGPRVADAFAIPYVIAEPSTARKRLGGPWDRFARASDAALARADRLFWTTARDRPALEAAGHGPRMVHLPACLEPGTEPANRPAGTPLRLLTVAMMRPGDKLESYRRLAGGLARLDGDWRLEVVGAGHAEPEVRAALANVTRRVRFLGTLPPAELRPLYESADLLVWPGVGEGVGMVWLEAQAAGLPVVAEAGPVSREIIAGGRLAAPGDPGAFSEAIRAAARDRLRLSDRARAHIVANHTRAAAAAILSRHLGALLR